MRLPHALATLLLLAPGALVAQDAPYRARLATLVAALDACMAVACVDSIAASMPKVGSSSVANLEQGFIGLRRGIVQDDDSEVVHAWAKLERVADTRPSWPWAQFGVATAAMELYTRRTPTPAVYRGTAGGTHYDGFILEMKEMLRREPAFREGMQWLVATLADDGDRQKPGSLMRLLAFAVDSIGVPAPADAYLVLARDRRTNFEPAQAAWYLDRYVRAGGDTGIMLLELARTEALRGNLVAAVEAYESGLNVPTRTARLFYLADLEWIATDAELRRIEALPFDSVPGGVRRFWTTRDHLDLRDEGSRLREHLRRWAYVHAWFRVFLPERRTAHREVFISTASEICMPDGPVTLDDYAYRDPTRTGGYRKIERTLDHRAVIYMRHGEPLLRFGGSAEPLDYGATDRWFNSSLPFTASAPGRIPDGIVAGIPSLSAHAMRSDPRGVGAFYFDRNTTWVYMIGGMPRVFSFYGHDALGIHQPTTLVVHRPPTLDVLLQLGAIDPRYARLAGVIQWMTGGAMPALPPACHRFWMDVVQEQREGTAVAVNTDSYRRKFARPAASVMQVFALGQPERGTGQLVVALGVHTRTLVPDSTSDSTTLRYRVHLEVRAIDTVEARVTRATRERIIEHPRGTPHTWYQFFATLPLEPGMAAVRAGIDQGPARGAVLEGTAEPAGRPEPIAMSDVVLGTYQDPFFRTRAGRDVAVSAFTTHPGDGVLSVYHEVYGTQAGQRYETRLTLYSVERRNVASSLVFSDLATGTTLVSQRALALSEVAPGEYRLRIEVEPASGGTPVARERTVVVQRRR